MSDEKTLERVKKLIALSTSPNEEEARTSAMLACQLIREHGFEVGLGRKAPPIKQPVRPVSKTRRPPLSSIIVGYDTWCKACGREIHAGTEVTWRHGRDVVHQNCDTGVL